MEASHLARTVRQISTGANPARFHDIGGFGSIAFGRNDGVAFECNRSSFQILEKGAFAGRESEEACEAAGDQIRDWILPGWRGNRNLDHSGGEARPLMLARHCRRGSNMSLRGIAGTLAFMAAMLGPLPALAHHSFAMFDNSRSVTLKGTVQKFQWTNPHGYLELEVQAPQGTRRYTLEMTSINMLSRAGWNSRTVKHGDIVTVLMAPLRDGAPGGLLLELTKADGKLLLVPVPNPQNFVRNR
jgi:hypothetical protein